MNQNIVKYTTISLAGTLLIGALIYANLINKDEPSITTGNNIGDLCPDVTLDFYGRDEKFTVSEQKGKILVINFWATWCGPCVAEIPHFEEVQNKYKDDIYTIAIHSNNITEDVDSYLSKRKWYDFSINFAQDSEQNSLYTALGGSDYLPMTFILDEEGIIAKKFASSITAEILETSIEEILTK